MVFEVTKVKKTAFKALAMLIERLKRTIQYEFINKASG